MAYSRLEYEIHKAINSIKRHMTMLMEVNLGEMRYLALVPCPKSNSNSSPGIGGALQICTKRVGGYGQRLCRYGAAQALTTAAQGTREYRLFAAAPVLSRALAPTRPGASHSSAGENWKWKRQTSPSHDAASFFFHDEQISPRQPQTRHRLSGPRTRFSHSLFVRL